MKRNIKAMIMPDDPIMVDAVRAMERYYQAKEAGRSESEVERLRQEAEQRFQSISDYQLAALGHQPLKRH